MTVFPAVISSDSTVTPGGKLSALRVTAPPKSSRLAWIRIAWRFPFGTDRAITLVPRLSDSLGVLNSSRGVTELISTRYVYSGPPFFRWSDKEITKSPSRGGLNRM